MVAHVLQTQRCKSTNCGDSKVASFNTASHPLMLRDLVVPPLGDRFESLRTLDLSTVKSAPTLHSEISSFPSSSPPAFLFARRGAAVSLSFSVPSLPWESPRQRILQARHSRMGHDIRWERGRYARDMTSGAGMTLDLRLCDKS